MFDNSKKTNGIFDDIRKGALNLDDIIADLENIEKEFSDRREKLFNNHKERVALMLKEHESRMEQLQKDHEAEMAKYDETEKQINEDLESINKDLEELLKE